MRHGIGKEIKYCSDGLGFYKKIPNTYTGEFKHNKKHGKGKMIYSSGGTYEGEWKEGFRDGKGILTKQDGDVYQGEWKCGLRHGKGILTKRDGRVYEGNWEEGFFENEKGILTYVDGE